MGFIKDVKASTLGTEAQKALDAGRAVFTPKLNTPVSQSSGSGNIADWSVMIEAVEAVGWRLADWCVALDGKGRPEAYPLFRRG